MVHRITASTILSFKRLYKVNDIPIVNEFGIVPDSFYLVS